MEVSDRLLQKIEQVSSDLIDAKRKNRQLNAELEALKLKVKDFQVVLKENDRYKRDLLKVQGRLERLRKKVEKALMVNPTIELELEGGVHEEHPQ